MPALNQPPLQENALPRSSILAAVGNAYTHQSEIAYPIRPHQILDSQNEDEMQEQERLVVHVTDESKARNVNDRESYQSDDTLCCRQPVLKNLKESIYPLNIWQCDDFVSGQASHCQNELLGRHAYPRRIRSIECIHDNSSATRAEARCRKLSFW